MAQTKPDLWSPTEMATLRSRVNLRGAVGDAVLARSDLQLSAGTLALEETIRCALFGTTWNRIHRVEAIENAEETTWTS